MLVKPLDFLIKAICKDFHTDKKHIDQHVYFIKAVDRSGNVDSLRFHKEVFIPDQWDSCPNDYWYGIKIPPKTKELTEETLVYLEKYEGEYRGNLLRCSNWVKVSLKEVIRRYAYLILTKIPMQFDN